MPCLEYLEMMNAVLDGEASTEEEQALEGHLAGCSDCRALYADLSALHSGADALLTEAPSGFTGRVMAAVRAEQCPKATFTKARTRRWRSLAAMAAVCAVALLGTGSLRYLQESTANDPKPQTAMENNMPPPVDPPSASSQEAPHVRCTQPYEPSPASSDKFSAVPAEETANPVVRDNASAFYAAPSPPQADTALMPNSILLTEQAPDDEKALTVPIPENNSAQRSLTPLEAMGLVVEEISADTGYAPAVTNTSQGENISCLLRLDGQAFVLTYTGLSDDGSCHRFLLLDRVYTVSLDGSQVLMELPAEK